MGLVAVAVAMGLTGSGVPVEPHDTLPNENVGQGARSRLGPARGDLIRIPTVIATPGNLLITGEPVREEAFPAFSSSWSPPPEYPDSAPYEPPQPLREASEPVAFAASDTSLSDYHEYMRLAEGQHGLPAGLLYAVAVMESSGGKHLYGAYNAWGYGPGIAFPSWEAAIDTVGARLAHWVGTYGLEGGLSVWVCGNPRDGLWYSREVIAMLAAP